MILEAVMLQVKEGMEADFVHSFRTASLIISSMRGYRSHELHQCMESSGKYLLLVRWDTLEDHTVGFRQSRQYEEWRKLLHHYYDPFPTVEHFVKIELEITEARGMNNDDSGNCI
jgi:heme-degrading monooxygenase HmoA